MKLSASLQQLQEGWRLQSWKILAALPAGIPPVKGNLKHLLVAEGWHALRMLVWFVAAGPVIDTAYSGQFEYEVDQLAFFACCVRKFSSASIRTSFEAWDIDAALDAEADGLITAYKFASDTNHQKRRQENR